MTDSYMSCGGVSYQSWVMPCGCGGGGGGGVCARWGRTSDQEHDDEDDWEPPEGDSHCLEGKVLHIIQLLHTV